MRVVAWVAGLSQLVLIPAAVGLTIYTLSRGRSALSAGAIAAIAASQDDFARDNAAFEELVSACGFTQGNALMDQRSDLSAGKKIRKRGQFFDIWLEQRAIVE